MIKLRKTGSDKMKSLLDIVQAYLIEHDVDAAMEEYQLPLIPSTQTFLMYGKEVDGGLSPLGGLIKYCSNAITVVKSGVEKNTVNIPIVIHIGEKMANIALVIRDALHDHHMTKEEQQSLQLCEALARDWLQNTHREALLADVNERVTRVKMTLSSKGILHSIRNQNEVLGPLLTWA